MELTAERIRFDFLPGLSIVGETHATLMSSDARMISIRQFDGRIGFTERFVAGLHDPRDPGLTEHGFDEMMRQRIYGVPGGYEDCNDHDALRSDSVFKLISGRVALYEACSAFAHIRPVRSPSRQTATLYTLMAHAQ